MPERGKLSPSQWKVMELVALKGYSYEQAAMELGIARSTVRTHANLAYKKLGVNKASDAILRMQELGWIVKPKPPQEPVEEGPLSPAQKAYLAVFDRHLRAWAAGDEAEESRTRKQMRWMLNGIYIEADRRFPDEAAERSRMAA